MLRASNLSSTLRRVSDDIVKSGCVQPAADVALMLVTSDGHLLSSSISRDSESFEGSQRVAAVSAAMASEYKALDGFMAGSWESFVLSAQNVLLHCSHFASLREGGSVLLVVSTPAPTDDKSSYFHGLLRSLAARVSGDLRPSLGPVMEQMISAPPVE